MIVAPIDIIPGIAPSTTQTSSPIGVGKRAIGLQVVERDSIAPHEPSLPGSVQDTSYMQNQSQLGGSVSFGRTARDSNLGAAVGTDSARKESADAMP